MTKDIFVTGASGFLGKALVAEMSKQGDQSFHLLVRSDRAREDLKCQLKSVDPERVHFLRGDITTPHFGLNHETISQLSQNVASFWHLAASTSFSEEDRAEIRRTNIEGTRNALEVASHFNNLEHFFYMGTAYVSGKNRGVIPEGRVSAAEGFKNPYEESKLECEEEVRKTDLPFTIIRPSILIGDSRTGSARGENRMVYGYLRAIYLASLYELKKDRTVKNPESMFWNLWAAAKKPEDFLNVPVRLNTDGNTTKNVVTIDDVVAISLAIKDAKDNRGKTYNVVNPHNVTMEEIVDEMQHHLHVRGFQYVPTLTKSQLDKDNPGELVAFKRTAPYFPYVHDMEPVWQDDNVRALGTDRKVMSPQRLSFLFGKYVENELRPNGK